MHIQKTHTLATKLQWVIISAGRWVFQHLEASLISSAWGEFWAVNKLLFQSFAVNISYSTGGDWRMKNSKCGSHHPYQPTQSGMWAGMWPAPLGSVLPKALAISIQNMLLVHNTHTHTPSCMHTHTHTLSHHLRARLGQPRAVNTPYPRLKVGKIGRLKYIHP